MRPRLVSSRTAWRVLPGAILGFAAGFLPRPESGSGSPHKEGNPSPPLTKGSPLGRPRGLPQTAARLEALRKAGSPTQQIAAALAFAEITSVKEIRDLLENSHRFPAHSAGEVALAALLKGWLDQDAPGAVEFCRRNQAALLPKLLANWSQTHPAEAAAWVQAMPGGPAQKTAWLGMCKGAAPRDSDKAWKMLVRPPGLDPRMGGGELVGKPG